MDLFTHIKSPIRFTLRDYQVRHVDAACNEFEAGRRSTLVVSATGTGKTIVFATIADRRQSHGRVMIIAHMDALIGQAASKLEAVIGSKPEIEKADQWAHDGHFVVASRQSLASGKEKKRFARFDPWAFGTIIIDEADTALCDTMVEILRHFNQNPDCKICGVTATPERGDKQALGKLFESVCSTYMLQEAVHDGWLVTPKRYVVDIPGLDFRKVSTVAGDMNSAEREAAMIEEKPLHGVVHATIEQACGLPQHAMISLVGSELQVNARAKQIIEGRGNEWADALRQAEDEDTERMRSELKALAGDNPRLKTLVFASGIKHAKRMADIFERWIPGSAKYVIGETPVEERDGIFRAFHSGEFQFLIGCDVMTVGFDEPDIQLMAMARPTKSRRLYIQMLGRGTRPLDAIAHELGKYATADERRAVIAASTKATVQILDFAGNTGKHQLMSVVDIFAGENCDQSILDRAREIMEAGETNAEAALEQAETDVEEDRLIAQMKAEEATERLLAEEEEERRREAAQRANIVATAKYDLREVDTFDAHAVNAHVEPEPMKRGGATEKQMDILGKYGVPPAVAQAYGAKQAWAVIDSLKAKRCSTSQAWRLKQMGYSQGEIDGMNFKAASAAIEAGKAVAV